MTKTKKQPNKKEINNIFYKNYLKEKEEIKENLKNNKIVINREDYITKSIKEIGNEFMDVLGTLHNLTIDKIYNLEILENEEPIFNNQYYDIYMEDYIKELETLKEQNLDNIRTKEQINKKIRELNISYLKKYFNFIKPNAIDLYDEDVRNRKALFNAERIVSIQCEEIKKYGYTSFLNVDLDKLDRPFLYYMELETLKKVQMQLKDFQKDLDSFSLKKLIKQINIDNQDLNLKLEIIGIEIIGNLEKKDIQDIKDNIVEYFLYLLLLFQEIKEHYIRVNNDLKLNNELYLKRHNNLKNIQNLVKDLSFRYNKIYNDIDNKNIVEPIKANNNIPTGYTLIENRLHKELEQLLDKTENPLDLKLDYQPTYKGKGHRKKTISTPVIVSIDINDNMDIQDKRFNAFDKFVINRAFSLWQVNKTHLSPELIYKDFINKDVDITQMGTDIYNAILESIEKFRTSTISFIFQDPATIKRLGLSTDEIEFIGKNRYILPLDKSFIKYKNGRIKYDYTYMGDYEPQYFILAEKIGQIKTANRKLIPTKTGFNMTKERMLIIDYLTHYIEFLKSTKDNKKYNNDLGYDKILKKCDLLINIEEGTPKYRQYKKKYLDDIKNILDQYKKDKIIKDYIEYPTDKKIKKGIKIKL